MARPRVRLGDLSVGFVQPLSEALRELGHDPEPLLRRYGITHVVLAGGIPPRGSVEAIKAFEGKALVFAPTLALAKRLLRGGADALVIVTEWKAFRSPDFDLIKAQLKRPLIVDGRNLYDPAQMRALGFEYLAIGR